MMNNVIRRDYGRVVATMLLIIGTLTLISALFPQSFGLFVGIFGATGAVLVIYEIHHTKRIAQATFVRDLNTAFTTDASISILWKKLLLDEEIEKNDRPLVSSYLTFFETVYLLLDRRVLDLYLVDNLFRNRFFTAIGNHEIQSMTLLGQPGSFLNIHSLIRIWSEFLSNRGLPQHAGYYSYIRAAAEQDGYSITRLGPSDIDAVLALQKSVEHGLSNKEWLRINTVETWIDCLAHHDVVGARLDGRLVAAAVMYDPGNGPESIARYVENQPDAVRDSLNLKIVLVDPTRQRTGLARTLIEILEHEALKKGKYGLLCTIHRENSPSVRLFSSLGYRKVGKAATAYGPREIYLRVLARPSRKRSHSRSGRIRLIRTTH